MNVFENDLSGQDKSKSSSFDSTTPVPEVLLEAALQNHQNNINLHIDQASLNSEKDSLSGEQNDHTILSRIYDKSILSDSIVMSKTDISGKLKHMSPSIRMREQAIKDLVNNKLLVIGDRFSLRSIKGIIEITGYLKDYPESDAQSQIEFASTLSKYSINFIDYEQSFKKDKVGTFPRTLGASDIKQSTWLYSQYLLDTILSNNFLKERLLIDPSAVIQQSDTEPQRHQRIQTSKRPSPPSRQK